MSNFEKRRQGGRSPRRGRGDFELRPIEVVVEGDNVERAIKILKRKMADEGIFRELKKRRYYEKPSEA